jgi:hypothetical protein
MTSEQRQFLHGRLRNATKAQPELKQLVRQLLKLGGDFVVAPPGLDPDAAELISHGFVSRDLSSSKPGEPAHAIKM